MPADQPAPDDPFGTAGICDRVLAAWTASPARFREDANAEDDLVRGSYRDRVVVELAQNAADAAARAGAPGRLRLTLADDVLVASNTGAPLDAAGAESLSTLRASTKRDGGSAGRFGVGFAAVLAVTDEPRLASTTGAVRWSTEATREAVVAVPELAAELARREGQLPVLRLPLADRGRPEAGYATTVRLPLRDAAADLLVRRLLADVDDALLLALPGLGSVEVVVDGTERVFADVEGWAVVRRSGDLDRELLRGRPVEERDRPWWSLTWARPLDGRPVPSVVHAPTPTDELLDLPALLVASFPLDPGRRHVAPGPLTDYLVARAAEAYATLAADAADPLALVPGPVPAGRLDGEIRAAVLAALSGQPLLRTVTGERVHPGDAVVVDGVGAPVETVLADVLPGLVADHPALRRLGVRRLGIADVVDLLGTVERAPGWWRGVYAAVAAPGGVDSVEALGALPVPLADGRTVRGPRGLLVPSGEPLDGLDALGLRVVHPDAAHPLLLRLGAVDAVPSVVVQQPEVRAAVAAAWDADEPAAVADAVLGLVAAAGAEADDLTWLGDLPLLDDEGELAAARELVLPGSFLDGVAEEDTVGRPAPGLLEEWGPDVLARAGVLAELAVVREEDVPVDADTVVAGRELDDVAGWSRALTDLLPTDEPAAVVAELLAVPDLDVVRDDAWEEVLAAVAADRDLRRAVVEPALLALGAGGRVAAPSYTAWWLRTYAQLAGLPPTAYAARGAGELVGLFEPLPDSLASRGIDERVLEAVGVRMSLAALVDSPDGPADLLERIADPARAVDAAAIAALYGVLGELEPDRVDPPDRVRVSAELVVAAEEALVLDAPQHLQLVWATPPVVVPLAAARQVADVLDLDTTGDRLGPVSIPGGTPRKTPAVARSVLPGAPATWTEHRQLAVAGRPVEWWVSDDGDVHARTVEGLARGLAWAAGRWDLRLLLAQVLETPARLGELLTEARLEDDLPG